MKTLRLIALVPAKILIFMATASFSQTTKTLNPDLQKLVEEKRIDVFNRDISLVNDGTHRGFRLDEREGDGLIWLKQVPFSNGTLEFDVKGKDVQGKSFVGIAFHGLDNSTFDAIYLRPFNFKASDKVRRSHCVQYISHPIYTWSKLREDFPSKYENTIEPAPDPNSWVHVRVVVTGPKISVFINENDQPSLVVEKLTQRATGALGFFAGNGSGGEFANLKINPTK